MCMLVQTWLILVTSNTEISKVKELLIPIWHLQIKLIFHRFPKPIAIYGLLKVAYIHK
jgi:hypothetical protein